jgi:Right handed beta helix region
MNKIRFSLKACAFIVLTLAFASVAQAQASRTWVSGTGDDANPCSRTAPCKTFAGAISKTADAGEIDCIDSGGFGTVTITKSITIDGGGTFASILAAGTNGVNVNDSGSGAPNTKVVALRNLSINGFGTGLQGINFTSARTLHIEDCVIFGFKGSGANSSGVNIALTTAVAGSQDVKIKNTVIRDNSGNGIKASNTAASANVLVVLDGVRCDSNANGLTTATGAIVQVSNSSFNFNTSAGINVTAGTTQVDIDTCFIESNANGIQAAASTTRIGGCRISGNGNGINFTGGTVQSFGDNKVKGNFTNDQLGGSVSAVPAPVKI